MYSLNERTYFETLGEIRKALAGFPDETEVCVGGVLGSYLHIDETKMIVSFDDDPLDEDYFENSEDEALLEAMSHYND